MSDVFTNPEYILAKSKQPAVPLPPLPNVKPPKGYVDVMVPLGPADRKMRRQGYKCDVIRVRRSSLVKRAQAGNRGIAA